MRNSLEQRIRRLEEGISSEKEFEELREIDVLEKEFKGTLICLENLMKRVEKSRVTSVASLVALKEATKIVRIESQALSKLKKLY